MNAARTARERARAELTREIKSTARRQLAEHGAHGLSLRAVSRELGMASSALYRYFPSRDDLLTALIVDAYDALGAAVEAADSPGAAPRARWKEVCYAVRDWARKHPHEYVLIYGSPVPGYRAPADTVTPAARAPIVMLRVFASVSGGTAGAGLPEPGTPSPTLTEQLRQLATTAGVDLPAATLGRALIVWTQLFGMISFELFGQFVGSVDPTDEFFAHAVEKMADFAGLGSTDL